METVITTIVWAAIIQGLLLSSLYVFSTKYRSRANRILGFFLLALVVEALSIFVPLASIGSYSIIHYFTTPEVKIFFPTLFFHFVLEKVGTTYLYRNFLNILYLLAFSIVGLTLINIGLHVITGHPIHYYFSSDTIESVFFAQQYFAFFMSILVFILSIRETLKYRRRIKNEFSDITLLEINWLWQFIFIMMPITLLWGAELVRIFLGGLGSESQVVLLTWGLVVLFIYFVSYKVFRHPNLFDGQFLEETISESNTASTGHKSDSSLCESILSSMQEHKFYLKQDLTIHDLSKEIKMSSRMISNCINQHLGVNFSEWVNNFRVEQAIRLLKDPDSQHLSIEGIGQNSGFKSRSSMYTAFKKKTGQTPGFYRPVAVLNPVSSTN